MLEEFIGLREARAARAAGPSADPAGLRRAYLDVLKLALCDLAGDTTVSVGKLEDGSVASRELSGADLRMRAAGMGRRRYISPARLKSLHTCWITEPRSMRATWITNRRRRNG